MLATPRIDLHEPVKHLRSTHEQPACQLSRANPARITSLSDGSGGFALGYAALGALWREYGKAEAAHHATVSGPLEPDDYTPGNVWRDRSGQVGGKTTRPFPLGSVLAAIPADGSKRGDWNREKGYPSFSDTELVDKLAGFYSHKHRGLTAHEGRLFFEFSQARAVTYRDLAASRQNDYGQGLPPKYRAAVFSNGFRNTRVRESIVWMLWRVHQLRKLCLSISAPDISKIATEDPTTSSVTTVWRTIRDLERHGMLVRLNTYRNRKDDKGGRPINFGDNCYVVGPRLLEIFEAPTAAERISRLRRAAGNRFRRMRQGLGVASPIPAFLSFSSFVCEAVHGLTARDAARVRVEAVERESWSALGALGDKFRALTDWTGAGPLFDQVAENREHGSRRRRRAHQLIAPELIEAPEPEHLRDAQTAVATAEGSGVLDVFRALLDSPAIALGLDRATMPVGMGASDEPPEIVDSPADGSARSVVGAMVARLATVETEAPETRIQRGKQCDLAANTYSKNTIPLWHGVPLDNGQTKRMPGTCERATIAPTTERAEPSAGESTISGGSSLDPIPTPPVPDPTPPSGRGHLRAGGNHAPSREQPPEPGWALAVADMARSGSEFAKLLLQRKTMATT